MDRLLTLRQALGSHSILLFKNKVYLAFSLHYFLRPISCGCTQESVPEHVGSGLGVRQSNGRSVTKDFIFSHFLCLAFFDYF